MPTRIQIRRSAASVWETANPVLADGEIGLENDTGRLKIGDALTLWRDLQYALDEAFSTAEKSKLEAIQAGATAAGALGDEHARSTGNPHATTPAQIGAEPIGAANAAVAAHQAATATVHTADQISDTAVRMLMTAAERNKLGGLPTLAAPASHVGAAGAAAHPSAVPSVDSVGGASGFMLARDKEKLNGIAVGAQPNPTQVTTAERTAGTETATRSYSPLDVKTMVQAHGLTSIPNADGLIDGAAKVIMTMAERSKLADIANITAPRSHVGAGGVAEHALVVPSFNGNDGVAGFMDPRDKENLDKLGPGNYSTGARNIGVGTGLFSARRTFDDQERGALEIRSVLGRQNIATSLSPDGSTVYLDYTGPVITGPALVTAIDAALGNTNWRTGGAAGGLPGVAQTITTSSTAITSPTVFLGGAGGALRLPPSESGVHAIDFINDGTGPWSLLSGGIVEGMYVTADLNTATIDSNLKVLSFDPHGLPSTDKLTLSWVMHPGSSNTNWMLLSTSPNGGANTVEIGSANFAGIPNAALVVQVRNAANALACDVRWPYTKNQLSICYLTIDLALPSAELWINGHLIPIGLPLDSGTGSPKWPPLPGTSFPFAAGATRSRLWIAGGQGSSRQEFDGALGRLWILPGQYLPGADNAAKFCVANSTVPAYLGSNGQIPTGIAPHYYLNGDNREFARNQGTIGGIGTFDPMVASRISSAATQFPYLETMSWGSAALTIPVGGTAALRRKATSPLTTWVEIGS